LNGPVIRDIVNTKQETGTYDMTAGKNSIITSTANPKIRAAARLRRRTERDRTGLMLIEGAREILAALRGGITVGELFVCERFADGGDERKLLSELDGSPVVLTPVGSKAFNKIAYRESTGGVIAVATRQDRPLDLLPEDDMPLLLVVDGVEKPGNLGAVFRSADGAGVTGIIVSDPEVELSNPNVIRASIGTVFEVPSAVAAAGDVIRWLKERGISIITTSPQGNRPYTDVDMTGATAIVLGSEDTGVSDDWLDASDLVVRIPMHGSADSLNVSAAATIMIYEAARQRRPAQ
jgi:TrmH family RNA methyltransferase